MRIRLAVVSCVFVAVGLPAQIGLSVTGGSLGTNIDTRLGPYSPFTPALIVLSATAGPTPLGILDPRDPRQLRVGVESLGVSFSGFIGVDTYLTGAPLPLPNQPWLVNRSIFFQGLTLDGTVGLNWLIGEVSQPRGVWFAPGGAFRNRFTQLSQPRAFFGEALPLDDGKWMAAAGGAGALLAQVALDTTEIYDPMTDTFAMGPRLVRPRSVHTTTQLNDGTWLFAAGVDGNNDPQNTSEILDPVLFMFRPVAGAMNAMRMGHTATRLPNGRVLVTGGLSDLNGTGIDPINSALASTEIYNPATDSWTPGPNMSRPRAGHIATVLPNGRILFGGGVGYTVFLGIKIPQIWTQTEIYDPVAGTFSNGPTMATARAIYSVATLGGGRFLFAGGVSSLLGLGTPTAACEIYDANTNSFSGAGSMAAARGMSAVFPLGGGRFLHIGGADGTLINPNALASTEIYDVATNAFSPGPPLGSSRAAFGTFMAPTGQFHLISGGTGMNAATTPTTEWYYR